MGAAGRQRAAQVFTAKRGIDAYLALYASSDNRMTARVAAA